MNIFKGCFIVVMTGCLSCTETVELRSTNVEDSTRTSIVSLIDTNKLNSTLQSKTVDVPDSFYIEADEFFRLKNKIKETTSFQYYINDTLIVSDGCLFQNQSKTEYLYVATYTDGYLPFQILFSKENIPDTVLKYMEIYSKSTKNSHSDIISFELKSKYKKHLISNKFASIELDSNFTSKYGIRLGMSINDALDLYPPAKYVEATLEYDYYFWDFSIDMLSIEGYLDDGYFNVEKFPMAKNTFGTRVIMIAQNDKLCAYIIQNDVP